jgi:hypothetical protein
MNTVQYGSRPSPRQLLAEGGSTETGREDINTFPVFCQGRKAAGSRPDEVNEFLSMYLTLPAALDPGVYSASNRNKYQKQKK